MKKILALLLAAVMCLSLVACGGRNDTPSTNDNDANNTSQETENSTTDNADYASELTQLLCEKNVWYGMRHSKGSEEEFTFFEDGHFEKNGSSFTWAFMEYLPDASEFLANHAFQTPPNYDATRGLYVTDEFLLGYDADGNLLLYWRDYFCYNASQYEVVEITLDNWQDYFELKLVAFEQRNDFDELSCFFPNTQLCLKEEWASLTTDMEVAVEYACTNGYLCWFIYNEETGEITEGDVDEQYGRTYEKDGTFTMKENNIHKGYTLFGEPHPVTFEKEDNIAKIKGRMYPDVEIIRIQGAITIEK